MRKRFSILAALVLNIGTLTYLYVAVLMPTHSFDAKQVLGATRTSIQSEMLRRTKPLTQALALARATTSELTKVTKLCIGGDVNLAESMSGYIASGMQPFGKIQPLLDTCDIHILNLETNVASAATGTRQNKNYAFKAPPATLSVLTAAKVAGVSLANNHTMDYGPDALLEEIKLLHEQKIPSFGAGNNTNEAFSATYFVDGENKIALIGINDAETNITRVKDNRPGSAYLDAGKISSAIAQARKNNALVIIMPHWGTEHQLTASAKQVQWGHMMIDAGANLVVGAHPHVRQNIEDYKAKKIFYSLGNYVFSGFADRPNAQKSMLVEVYIYKNQIKQINPVQLQLDWFGFPSQVN